MTTQTEALKLALEAFTIVRFCVPPAQRPTIERAITTTIEALAQPEREPVAHSVVEPLRHDEYQRRVSVKWVNQPVAGPLYTTPPQRKPLTNEQRETMWGKAECFPEPWHCYMQGIADTEAAHGIKE